VGESSFWYRPTRVVPDQRPLNGRRRRRRRVAKRQLNDDKAVWTRVADIILMNTEPDY